MKTFDEVIKALDFCTETGCNPECPYEKECLHQGLGFPKDALYYLKMYRRLEMAYVKALADIEENPALSWNELKQMEGKPVWVDGSAFAEPFWTIITGFMQSGDAECIFFYGEQYWRDEMRDADDGISWQAYRKERE